MHACNTQEKRYRSMQEHIRRAHPDYYIPKLPATEESFQLMVNTPPSHRPQPPPVTGPNRRGPCMLAHPRPRAYLLKMEAVDASEPDFYGADISAPATPGNIEGSLPAAANAAVALAQLHHQLGPDWDSDAVSFPELQRLSLQSQSADKEQEGYSEPEMKREKMRSSVELPSLRDQFRQDGLSSFQSSRQRELLPSILSHSPPGRFNSLPPIQRRDKLQRPRKESVGQHARKAKHDRTKSKEFGRRLSIEGRKAMSAEPPTAAWVQGKRWEDLIEAATSATEADDDRDLTPVCCFRYHLFYAFVAALA
jgi:hypothetical protein